MGKESNIDVIQLVNSGSLKRKMGSVATTLESLYVDGESIKLRPSKVLFEPNNNPIQG